MTFGRLWLVFGALLSSAAAQAQPSQYTVMIDKYHITDEERSACQNDALVHCSTAYPDEDALLACMKAARPKLTVPCRTVFEAGLKRRHIPF